MFYAELRENMDFFLSCLLNSLQNIHCLLFLSIEVGGLTPYASSDLRSGPIYVRVR